jgi:hypothetical protein
VGSTRCATPTRSAEALLDELLRVDDAVRGRHAAVAVDPDDEPLPAHLIALRVALAGIVAFPLILVAMTALSIGRNLQVVQEAIAGFALRMSAVTAAPFVPLTLLLPLGEELARRRGAASRAAVACALLVLAPPLMRLAESWTTYLVLEGLPIVSPTSLLPSVVEELSTARKWGELLPLCLPFLALAAARARCAPLPAALVALAAGVLLMLVWAGMFDQSAWFILRAGIVPATLTGVALHLGRQAEAWISDE